MEADPILDWKLKSASNNVNIVVIGKLGNGKSATGNSILGKEAFLSKYSPLAVTRSCELQGTTLKDGRIVNVIDTPGLFNSSTSLEQLSVDIAKTIDLAKDGIHAVLVVFSFISRISGEEINATIEILKSLFGDKIFDYMIVVLTNRDIFESRHGSLEDFIRESAEPLRNIIQLCKNRVIAFDNITNNIMKREKQINELLSLVDLIVMNNGGKSYSNNIFEELKEAELLRHQKIKQAQSKGYSEEELSVVMKEINKSYDDEQKRVAALADKELKLSIERFLKQQAEMRAEQLEALLQKEKLRRESLAEEIRKIEVELNEIRRKYEKFKKRKAGWNFCLIV